MRGRLIEIKHYCDCQPYDQPCRGYHPEVWRIVLDKGISHLFRPQEVEVL